jgi:hypothetical protein
MVRDNMEQQELVMAMERCYAAMSELRDVIYGDNWDDKLEAAMLAMTDKWAKLTASYAKL